MKTKNPSKKSRQLRELAAARHIEWKNAHESGQLNCGRFTRGGYHKQKDRAPKFDRRSIDP